MRLAMLIAAACLGAATVAHADGKDEKTLLVPPIAPLEATGAEAAPLPVSLPPGHEPETYRFGATYSVMDAASALACEAACDDALSCQAWSFVDTYGASAARCELKRGQGRKEENRLATSGIATKLKNAALGEPPEAVMTPALAPGQLQGGLAEADEAASDIVETADAAALTPAPAPSSP